MSLRFLCTDISGCGSIYKDVMELTKFPMGLWLLCTDRGGCEKVDKISNEFKVLVHRYKRLWQDL